MSKKSISPEKIEAVTEIREKIENSRIAIVTDYRGLKVNQLQELRKGLVESESNAKVYKNTLVKIALRDLDIDFPEEYFSGPTMVIVSTGDSAKAAKTVVNFNKQNEALHLKGGILDNKSIDDKVVLELSKLPSREELVAQTIAGIKSPITNFVMNMSSPIRGFIYALNAIQNKKQEVK